jgi:acyl-CoA thioesterase-1
MMGAVRLGDDKPVSDMREQRGSGKQDSLRRLARASVALAVLGVLQGCGGGGQAQSADRPGASASDTARADTTLAATQTPLPPGSSVDPGPKERGGAVQVLFIGTSLTAGLGLADPADAWPGRVGRIADSLGYAVRVQNAGLSGETSAGALRRADWLLKDPADVVVIETGANDGLRGLSVADLRRNLTAIIAKVRERQPAAQVVVVQMEAPPNLGGVYSRSFGDVFGAVARETGATLTPFLLDGVAGIGSMNQADGIHPTEEGADRAARNVWPVIRGVLDRVVPPKV